MTTPPPLQNHDRPWGHDIHSPKPSNTTRPYYKNTSGIGTGAFTNRLMDTSNQLFHEWITDCRLVSIHKNLYDEDYYKTNQIPTTYQHGGKTIDHVFCTPQLFGCVTGVAIEPLHEGIYSDHQALVVDFDTAQLLSQPLNISKPKTMLGKYA
jgi:exonuclease III